MSSSARMIIAADPDSSWQKNRNKTNFLSSWAQTFYFKREVSSRFIFGFGCSMNGWRTNKGVMTEEIQHRWKATFTNQPTKPARVRSNTSNTPTEHSTGQHHPTHPDDERVSAAPRSLSEGGAESDMSKAGSEGADRKTHAETSNGEGARNQHVECWTKRRRRQGRA